MGSKFTGKLSGLIGQSILALLLCLCTLGLGTPWAICKMIRWYVGHIQLDGNRLYFDGTGMQLLGNIIKWVFFTVITLGLYLFWLGIKISKWIVSHIHHLV